LNGDPFSAGDLAGNLGAGALARGRDARWELAEVIMYHSATHSVDVRTVSGRPLKDVPQLRPGPNDFEHLKTGTTVILSYDLGFTPIIIGTINLPGTTDTVGTPTDITGVAGIGSDNPLQPSAGANNFKPPNAPNDLTQGDWARIGTMGNYVAVLEGSVSAIGAPTAQVRSLGLQGLLQLIGQRIHTITDFGEWKTTNNQGRTSFQLRAGSNQTTQTGLDEQHWTFNLDMGATGDLFRFEITTPDGSTLFRLSVGPEGQTQIFGGGGVDISSGDEGDAETVHDIEGDEEVTVGGDSVKQVDGDCTLHVTGAGTDNIGTDKIVAVGNDAETAINRNEITNVGGNRTEIIAGGDPKLAKPGNVALSTSVLNGGWMIDIGDPSKGANISAQAGYALQTSLGDISFDSGGRYSVQAKQQIDIKSQTTTNIDGQQVWVGGSLHPAPIWDTYLSDHMLTMSAILAALSSNTPPGGGAPLLGAAAAIPIITQFITKLSASSAGPPYSSTKVKNG
jgi:hypothetical protein